MGIQLNTLPKYMDIISFILQKSFAKKKLIQKLVNVNLLTEGCA